MKRDYPEFDRERLTLKPLSARRHDLDLGRILALEPRAGCPEEIVKAASAASAAAERGAAAVMMIGAHVIRAGVQRYIIDMMEKGHITCLAMNGAGVIHDFELSLIGATTESVARYIEEGRFGLWRETGRINDIVSAAAGAGLGLGEAVGAEIESGDYPNRDISILAAAYRLGVPATVHVGIGYDIVHEHPNCDGAAYGATSYRDFLRFAAVLERLEGGVVMNFGSSIMGPEVFLKALAMARNAAHARGARISAFTSLVCDLVELPEDYRSEASKDNPGYYFRPWKTLLVRGVSGGGESFYVRGDHRDTIPWLWTALNSETGG